ncbi:MAG: hypothetical protein GF398_21340 [Chitinivibrionales bacterium]|nr:hypothetical protein [Chitinivibrionales bacterium]
MSKQPSGSDRFRTVVDVPRNPASISHQSTILSIGSCFAEHIGTRLSNNHFATCRNPTGILYNPESIGMLLDGLLHRQAYREDDLIDHAGAFYSFDHHGAFCGGNKAETLERINRAWAQARHWATGLDTLLVTLGTAWVYRLKSTGRVVANCHKMPHDSFERHLLEPTEIAQALGDCLQKYVHRTPCLNIILTISPVRHLRDNPHANSVSKAHLMTAVFQLEQQIANVYYFPAYEIMMDELRDYRFYECDMVHPSKVAQQYIWDGFCRACIDRRAREFIDGYTAILNARHHRIQQSAAPSTRHFAQKQLQRVRQLQSTFPHISLQGDADYFSGLCAS